MILHQIEQDFIHAYKNKDDVRVRVLRLIKTAIKHLQVELKRAPSDEEILDLLYKQLKQRKDAIEQFTVAQRDELVQKEQDELEIIKSYLPEPITGNELRVLVQQTIQNLQITSNKEFGKVMSVLTKEYKGRIDGKELQQIVQDSLQNI